MTYRGTFTAEGQQEQGVAYIDETLRGVVHNGQIPSLTVIQAQPVPLAPPAAQQGAHPAALPQAGAGGQARRTPSIVAALMAAFLVVGLVGLGLRRRRRPLQ